MALRFMQEVSEGECIPWGYGIAWWEWKRDRAVAMPVPFNVLARMLRDVWLFLLHPGPVPINPRSAYLHGYKVGRASMAEDLEHAGVVSRANRNDRSTPCA